MRCGGRLSALSEKLESITLYYTVSSSHTKSPPKEYLEYHQELTVGFSARHNMPPSLSLGTRGTEPYILHLQTDPTRRLSPTGEQKKRGETGHASV